MYEDFKIILEFFVKIQIFSAIKLVNKAVNWYIIAGKENKFNKNALSFLKNS